MYLNYRMRSHLLMSSPTKLASGRAKFSFRLLYLCVLVSMTLLTACGETPDDPETESSPTTAAASPAEIPLVTLHTAATGRLPLRRRANGKLRARREITIKSRAGGLVTRAPLEGVYYKDGDLLLVTDPAPLELARARAVAARDEARFRHEDLQMRLSMNLPPGDTTITELARRNILIQSGLPTAEVALREADFQLSLARLPAPFGGRAADVKVQAGQQITAGEEICMLIDPNSLEAEFSLLEQELDGLRSGGDVFVAPAARPELRIPAALDIVNPRVEDGGLLRVRARLRGKVPAGLYPGMNVTVTLERSSPEVVLLPKSAVVTRSGRSLVFTYDEGDGRAKWQYVTVGYENDELVGVTEGVEIGQAVIVGGNLTLDHDVGVRVEND